MPILKDLNDYSEFNPDLNHLILAAVDDRKEKHRWGKHISEVGDQWLGYVYDMIGLFTLATVIAILLKLVFS